MVKKGSNDGEWYAVYQVFNFSQDDDKGKYGFAEIWDNDEQFSIMIDNKTFWFDKNDLKEVFKEIFNFK